MSKIYIGIDLGKKGAIVFMKDGVIIHKEKMPLIADEDVDVVSIGKIIRKHGGTDNHAVFEKFAGFFGYSKMAAVSLARQSGFVESCLVLLKIPYTRVVPQTWQKVMWEGAKTLTNNKGKKDTKAISLTVAKRLFPKESFLFEGRASKPHDGLIDAVLLAEFGRRKGY